MPAFKVDFSGLVELADKLYNDEITAALMEIPKMKGVAALVSQAIADNFDKEGPGWQALQPQTIKRSVSKAMRKKLQKLTGNEIREFEELVRKKGRNKYDSERIAELNVKMGVKGKKPIMEPTRMILQKSGLLKKTVTIPGYSGSNKDGVGGSNIMRTEGTNLIYGTNLVYAGVHNYGDVKKGIPKREYLVVREEWMRRIENYVAEKAMDILRKKLL